jgi:hypothetical protein
VVFGGWEKRNYIVGQEKNVLEAVASEILGGKRNREKALGILGWPFGQRRDNRPVEEETGIKG